MTNVPEYLQTMRAEHIPEGWANIWFIRKAFIAVDQPMLRHGKPVILPQAIYTFLHRVTDDTLYRSPPGEVVMEDTPFELQTHMGFVLQARGRVLVTGLGLGCVIRGLLINPAVEHVTVIENSLDVLQLVAPHMPKERLTIIDAEALEWTAKNKESFDCAWHDLWTDRGSGEPHLNMWHTQLLANCRKFIKRQGAWDFPREGKRKLSRIGFPWIG
jgi:hypothetical protein